MALSETANAVGEDMRVIPGYGFALEGHQTPSLNQAWLVVRVEHQGYQSGILEEDAVERNSSDSHPAITQPLSKKATAMKTDSSSFLTTALGAAP